MSGSSTPSSHETLAQLLARTIREGAPLYNDGNAKACYDLYFDAAKYACMQEKINSSAVGQLLEQATDEAMPLGEKGEYAEAAWVLRRCFDDVLSLGKNTRKVDISKSKKGEDEDTTNRRSSATAVLLRTSDGDQLNGSISSAGSTGEDGWQDELTGNSTDLEVGQTLSNIAYVLRASITPKKHKRFNKSYEGVFPASEAVEVLLTLGLAHSRKRATRKLRRLWQSGVIKSVSHATESELQDGTHLYRFATEAELHEQLADMRQSAGGIPDEGSDESVFIYLLESLLELPSGDVQQDQTGKLRPVLFSGVSARHLQARRNSQLSPEHIKGQELADVCKKIEKIVDTADRKHNFKNYKDCFVGNEAISKVVEAKLSGSRAEACHLLNELLSAGLLHHVVKEHIFEDKRLFYEFTSVGDIKKALDAYSALPSDPTGAELVNQSALIQRYKQFTGLNVSEILNSFFGCKNEEGWDLVELDNWRHNMKRWGFGRREDQDDEMVDKLAPLALNVDPDTWDVEGDEEWESPFGILAQIAIFDQVPRSAFRGTADAFKWDHLAIRATKVAIEKGYFDTAFKSTLNQFLLLLPLEHSESWEDQKLGVTLLLRLLSTVAVQDEGFSDFEIVKRLEFSKRLSVAFLEHAQVIAKFKRYPHRNKPHGRTTTLEERVWLASDLVPRWAKSQNPDSAKNVIQLPVIPLKRLTRGR